MKDFREGDKKHLSQAGDIIFEISQHRPIPMKRKFNFEISSEDEDMYDVTDYKLHPIHHIAFRWRDNKAFSFKDVTFMYDANNGAHSMHEWDKIRNGKGEYFLYTWLDENNDKIENYVFFDLDPIRNHLVEIKDGRENSYTGCYFYCYPIWFLEKYSAIIDASFIFNNKDGTTNEAVVQTSLF